MKNTTGFTLVELLIAIAIVAILASVILPRLQGARERGVETKIISELSSFQKNALAEEFVSGNFNVVCGMNSTATSSALLSIAQSLQAASEEFVCNSTVTAFAASAQLNAAEHWCVDSGSGKGEISSALGVGVTACP